MIVPQQASRIARHIQAACFAVSAGTMVALSALVTTSVQQDAPATLAFSPVPETILAGEQATYSLSIVNATRLFGADIEISFDPEAIAVVDADPSKEGVQVHVGPFLDPGFVVYNVADNAGGTLRVTFTQLAPTAPASGSGALISIEVRATGGGDPALEVSGALLARDDGSPQPVILHSQDGTPAPPQGSPAPNPTEIPRPTSTATAADPTVSSQLGTASPAITPGGATTIAAETGDDSDSVDWTPAWFAVAVAALAAVGAGLRFWRQKLQRNGETK